MLVCTAWMRSEETYFVFRNDGSQSEVVFRNGVIIKEKPELTEDERYYFTSGQYKEIKNKY